MQVFNVCTSPVVQQAWDSGQHVAVHGVVYSVEDGLLKVRRAVFVSAAADSVRCWCGTSQRV